jgi:hypothetical protein
VALQFSPLSVVRQRLVPGNPVPFNILRADHTLLLARGQMLSDAEQLESLLERGALVETDDIKGARGEVFEARADELPALWGHCIARAGRALHAVQQPNFKTLLDEAVKPLLALVDRDPDLAIFQIVRPQTTGDNGAYGVGHSVYAAVAAYLVAKRLAWDRTRAERAFNAALTMNIAMVDLQSRLALQTTPPTAVQRAAIKDHPTRGAALLKAAGIADETWLAGVEDHHDTASADELAGLLHCVDIYTAKLSPRASRGALPAHKAGHDIFLQASKNPFAAALVKEFGIYPPGCFVKLQSGETAVAIKRGASASTPVVAALVGRQGDILLQPVRRSTDAPTHAITGVVAEASLKVRLSPPQLAAMAASR